MTKLLAVLILIVAVVHQGTANDLKCYQCSASSHRDACYDPNSSKSIKPTKCSDNLLNSFTDKVKSALSDEPLIQVCLKSAIRLLGELVIHRECSSVRRNEILTADKCHGLLSQALGGEIEYCGICDGNGCNPASVVRSTTFVLFLSTLLYALLI